MMKIVPKIFQSLLIALAIGMTLLLGNPWMTAPAVAADCDATRVPLLRETGWVNRVNVLDLNAALRFYEEVLGLTCNPTFYEPPFWAEVYSEEDPATSIGLAANPYVPFEPKQVTTQIVPDLASACIELKEKGVPIEHSEYAGSGVCLAFFGDNSGNELAYRQEQFSGDPELACDEIVYTACSPGF